MEFDRTMKIITVYLEIQDIKRMKKMCWKEDSLYPSRSELIRVAIRDFLIKELQGMKSFISSPIVEKKEGLETVLHRGKKWSILPPEQEYV